MVKDNSKKGRQKTVSIDEGLDKAIDRSYRKASEEKAQSWKSLIVLAGIVILLAFYGFSHYGKFSSSHTSAGTSTTYQKSSSSDNLNLKPTDKFTKSLVVKRSDFYADLSLENYEKLGLAKKVQYSIDYKSGQTLEEVIKMLGKASNAYYGSDNKDFLQVSYTLGDYQDYSDLRTFLLYFQKQDGTYYLTEKQCSELKDPKYPTIDESDYIDKWSEYNLNKVVVGDAETGEGGSTYEDLVAIGGKPVYSDISNLTSYDYDRPLEMRIRYRKLDANDKWVGVDFTLKQQKDGVYRVSNMSTD